MINILDKALFTVELYYLVNDNGELEERAKDLLNIAEDYIIARINSEYYKNN